MTGEERGAGPAAGPVPETRTVHVAAAAPERRIGPYRILRELGRGGMGTVYLAARADEQFHKRVALKIIRSGAGSEEVVRHFKRERQILAGLDHPNIAKLLDGGTTDDGLPYFVMEHIEGLPLLEYCDARSLAVPDRLRLFQSVCSAVQYAHRNLVVHRDIKPGNVLVAEDGTPKLLDFGIAKLLNPELAGEAPTATGLVMTPEYASPEQARGERITTATDVYSLGVVLYELLTGHHPYRLTSRQPLDVLKAVAEQEPERASVAVGRSEERTPEQVARDREGTPQTLQRRLKGDLDNILMMALRKEPQRRYASVEAFSDDVRRYLEGLPVKARKPTLGYRAGKLVRRHVLGAAASLAALLLLVGFAVAMAVQSQRVARERDLARKERATAQRVSAFLVELFKVSDPGEARGNSVTAREVLDKGVSKIASELKDQPEVRATLMDTMGEVHRNLGLYDKSIALTREALETRKATLGGEHVDVATSLNNLGNALYDKGDYAAAEGLFREALALRRKLLGNEHPDVATSLSNLANVLYRKGDYQGAEELGREALALRRRLFGNEHLDVAKSLNNLGVVLMERGDYDGAEQLYREALALRRKLHGNEHPSVATGLNNLANVLAQKGDWAGAEAVQREALALGRKLHGNEHPGVAFSLSNLAIVLMEQGSYAEAEALHREALAMRRKLLGNESPNVAMTLTGLAETLCRTGRSGEAEPHAREAIAVFRKTLPAGHPYTAEAESVLGGCLTLSRRYAEAEPLLLGSYPVLEARMGARSLEARWALRRTVRLYEAWGRADQAAQYRARLPPASADARP